MCKSVVSSRTGIVGVSKASLCFSVRGNVPGPGHNDLCTLDVKGLFRRSKHFLGERLESSLKRRGISLKFKIKNAKTPFPCKDALHDGNILPRDFRDRGLDLGGRSRVESRPRGHNQGCGSRVPSQRPEPQSHWKRKSLPTQRWLGRRRRSSSHSR